MANAYTRPGAGSPSREGIEEPLPKQKEQGKKQRNGGRWKGTKHAREKELRALQKEERQIWEAQDNLGLIELEKPIRHGWYCHLVLRKDIAQTEQAEAYQNIIDVAGMRIWGRTKEKAEQLLDWHFRGKHWPKSYQLPGLHVLDTEQYESLNPKARKFYFAASSLQVTPRWYREKYHCSLPQWYFELDYTKAYITHRKVLNPDLQSREAEIESTYRQNKYWNIGHRDYWSRRWQYLYGVDLPRSKSRWDKYLSHTRAYGIQAHEVEGWDG